MCVIMLLFVSIRSHTNRVVVRLAIVLHEGEFVGKRGVTPLANVLLRPRTLQHLRKQQCSLQVVMACAQDWGRGGRGEGEGEAASEGESELN